MNKKYLYIGGAALLVLAYLWYRNQSSGSSSQVPDTTGTVTPDTSGSGFSDLSGGLASQSAQEASDVAGINSQLGTLASTVQGLAATQANTPAPAPVDDSSEFASLSTSIEDLASEYAAVTTAPVAPTTINITANPVAGKSTHSPAKGGKGAAASHTLPKTANTPNQEAANRSGTLAQQKAAPQVIAKTPLRKPPPKPKAKARR